MDYLDQPFLFKVKKVARYALMYGVSRTYVKVMGQLHMRRKYANLPVIKKNIGDNQIVGIIGCGNYSFSTIAYHLDRAFGKVIGICMDRNIDRAASMSSYYGIPLYTSDPEEVLKNNRIRLIYIASNHASHAEYGIEALLNGKDVYIEKPHVVSEAQLVRLVETMDKSDGKVFLGFNRPGSRFGRIIHEYLQRESGSGMYNWFVAGHSIDPDHWYFRPEEGGRVLGNLCHWTDFILRLVPGDTYPIEIDPTRARKSDSDIVVTYRFKDDTIAVISFSAKGHMFEGVKERFSAHKGNCLITMDDYRRMTVEVVDVKKRFWNFYRDHGHAENIVGAFESVRKNVPYDREANRSYVWNTGWLFLKTREALEENKKTVVHSFEERRLDLDGWQA